MQWMENSFNLKTNIPVLPVDSTIHLWYNVPKVDLQSLEYMFSIIAGLTFVITHFQKKFVCLFPLVTYHLHSQIKTFPLQLGLNCHMAFSKHALIHRLFLQSFTYMQPFSLT